MHPHPHPQMLVFVHVCMHCCHGIPCVACVLWLRFCFCPAVTGRHRAMFGYLQAELGPKSAGTGTSRSGSSMAKMSPLIWSSPDTPEFDTHQVSTARSARNMGAKSANSDRVCAELGKFTPQLADTAPKSFE